jgi:hypothetical protein
MGLFGAIIVYPAGAGFNDGNHAYNHADSQFDREYLFMFSEIDVNHQEMTEFGMPIDTTLMWPVYWFINGRNMPDTLMPAGAPWLPAQPYNILPFMHPGERVLLRYIGASRHAHPQHNHGNFWRVIARDGRLLSSGPGNGADLSYKLTTIAVAPGTTWDGIWTWTGKGLNWDIYGTGPGFEHECVDGNGDDFDDTTYEYCPDHGKAFPVILPAFKDLTLGGFYSGSPFLGHGESLPPGEGGLNPFNAFTMMWHDHHEKEIVNNDVFPGGIMTMLFIVPWSVTIP